MVGTESTPIIYTKQGSNGGEVWVRKADGTQDQKVGTVTSTAFVLEALTIAIGEAGFPRGSDGKMVVA